MQTQQYYNFISDLLKEQKVSSAKVSQRIKNSVAFKNLERSGIVKKERAVNGGFNFLVMKQGELQKHFQNKFPNPLSEIANSFTNTKTFKDSKAKSRRSQKVVLLRGTKNVSINNATVELGSSTKHFGLFATTLESLEADKICIVENLDVFLKAEKVIPNDFVFFHSYGRLGKELIKSLKVAKILVFSDFDYIGLKEYLLVKSEFANTTFFMPENYEQLFKTSAKPLKKKNEGEQKPTKTIKESIDEIVIRIREQLLRTNKFLEQQALFEE